MKAYTLLIIALTTAIYSCGQNTPMTSDTVAEQSQTLATRITIYETLNDPNASLANYLGLTPDQKAALTTLINNDIAQRNALIEAVQQGILDEATFAQRKAALNENFSVAFLNILNADQLASYDVLRKEVLNAYYVANTDHAYLNIIKLVELIND